MFIIENAVDDLQPYVDICRETTGEKRINLLCFCMSMKDIYQFSELLEIPSVRDMRDSTKLADVQAFNTLELFAYGIFPTYFVCPNHFLKLTPVLLKKLRQLTILSLAHADPIISFDVLMEFLNVDSIDEAIVHVREAISDGAIQATINDKRFIVKVHSAYARDDPLKYPTLMGNPTDESDERVLFSKRD